MQFFDPDRDLGCKEVKPMPQRVPLLRMSLVALLVGGCLAACAGLPSHDGSNGATLPLSPRGIAAQASDKVHEVKAADFLFWTFQGHGGILKLRISDGRQTKKVYGVPGFQTFGLAIDNRQNVLQAFGNGEGKSGFAIFNKRLVEVNETMLPAGSGLESIASDGSNNIYLIVVTGPPSNYEIEVFARDAYSPFRKIGGTRTGLFGATAMAVDKDGYTYVIRQGSDSSPAAIEVFSPDAKGDVKPTRVISGAATGLSMPTALVLGGDGNIYIANQLSSGCNILVFPMAGQGNIAPVRVLNSKHYGASIALDGSGQMYLGPGPFGKSRGFAVFAAGASGDDAPIGFVRRDRFDENLYPGPLVIRYPWYVP
jgi:hypothetical protein